MSYEHKLAQEVVRLRRQVAQLRDLLRELWELEPATHAPCSCDECKRSRIFADRIRAELHNLEGVEGK